MKLIEIPESVGEYGYLPKQIQEICEMNGIDQKAFSDAFGDGHTYATDSNGLPNYYSIDIARALLILGYDVKIQGAE